MVKNQDKRRELDMCIILHHSDHDNVSGTPRLLLGQQGWNDLPYIHEASPRSQQPTLLSTQESNAVHKQKSPGESVGGTLTLEDGERSKRPRKTTTGLGMGGSGVSPCCLVVDEG
ncbi:hypothetical protein PQX77_013194 [Marasmius sp. AFHP31]|nr:hypothetical protein PQX77_013194 [Marasmius sp. AFHP31]